MKKIFRVFTFPMMFLLAITSCTKSFEDINTDPDALAEVPPANMLANVLRNTGESFGGDVDGYGTFAGYIVKIQYLDYMSGLVPTNNTYGNRWYACYYNLAQLNDVLQNTNEEGDRNIRLVARLWQSYMWQYLTDGWRDVPFSEALKGSESEGFILKAKYDWQEEIYPAVMDSLKRIADDMAAGFGDDNIGEADLIYGGDMARWQRFCNSLRLRMAIHISGVSPELARATIEEIAGNPGIYPVIDDNDANCYLYWPGAEPYYEPWYNNGY